MSDHQKIFQVLHSIPKGCLCSYGDVAKLAGLPGKARWVGRVLSQLPPDSKLPWFRVVNAQGRISFPTDSESYYRQLNHLIEEDSADRQGKLRWRQRRWPESSPTQPAFVTKP